MKKGNVTNSAESKPGLGRALSRPGPFDSAPCPGATLADLNTKLLTAFLARARSARGLLLGERATPTELLTHLNLLDEGRPTNAAVLLFGRKPQRFISSSVVKCAHFHGTEAIKPIPSHQVFRGTVFELVDQAVDFVLSRTKVTVEAQKRIIDSARPYELPLEVVREAIVNAVAHRDYSSDGCVQVMLLADRLELFNPGTLPPPLTVDMLRRPHDSVPRNPLVAKCLYLARYTERVGTGTRDMIMTCRGVGLPVPLFALRDGFVISFGRPS